MAESEHRERIERLLRESPSVQCMARSPFLLALLCWVGEREELPEQITRTEIYDRVVRDLFGLPKKGLGQVDEKRAVAFRRLLQEIAFQHFLDGAGKRGIPYEELLEWIANSKRRPLPEGVRAESAQNLEPGAQAEDLIEELEDKRILVPFAQGAAYAFPHRSIAEYLTACELSRRLSSGTQTDQEEMWKLVDRKAWDPDWEQVVVFLAGKLSGKAESVRPVLTLLANEKTDDMFRHRLAVAAQCLPEITSEARTGLNKEIDGIARTAFGRWWKEKTEQTEALVPHLQSSLMTLAGMEGGASSRGTGVLDWLLDLTHDADRRAQQHAVDALAGMGGAAAKPAVLARLLELAIDAEEDIDSNNAIDALGRTGHAAAQPAFLGKVLELTHDTGADVRLRAAWVLQGVGSVAPRPEVLSRLLELTRDTDGSVRASTASAIGHFRGGAAGPEVLARLVEMTQDRRTGPLQDPAEVLGRTERTTAQAKKPLILIDWTHIVGERARQCAVMSLGKIGGVVAKPEVMSRLLELTYDAGPSVRMGAVWALTREDMGDMWVSKPEVLSRLLEMTYNSNPSVQDAVVMGLTGGTLGSRVVSKPEVLSRLLEMTHDTERDVRKRGVEALGRVGSAAPSPEVLSRLLEMTYDADRDVLAAAVGALGRVGSAAPSSEVLSRLLEMTYDADRDVLAAAVGALGETHGALGNAEVMARLAMLMCDANRDVRPDAAEALWQIGDSVMKAAAIARLFDLVRGGDHRERHEAAKEVRIERRGLPLLRRLLLGMLEFKHHVSCDYIRERAAQALTRIGSAAANAEILDQLLKLTRAPDESVRREAAEALAGITGRKMRLFKRRFSALGVRRLSELSHRPPSESASLKTGSRE